MMRIDARLPLRFGRLEDRKPGDAVITDGVLADAPAAAFTTGMAGHALDCACCTRSNAATALAGLFRDRAIGPMFTSVLAVVGPEAEAEIRVAIQSDPVVSARFRTA